MKKLVAVVGVAVLAAMETFAATDVAGDGAETSRATLYRTTAEAPFRVRDCPLPSKLTSAGANVIDLDAAAPCHEFLGLGVSFAEASAYLLANQTEAKRREILELLWTDRGAGLSIGRVHLGSSDYSMHFYTYDDVPGDDGLAHFSIDEDRRFVLPAIRAARAVNPDITFFASPWSPPAWMKASGTLCGGQVKPSAYPTLANYFVRFVRAYEREGIPVSAVTIQNEPETEQDFKSPTCRWTMEDARTFIGEHLAPAFAANGVKTKIWAYDHNFDAKGIAYVTNLLADARVRSAVSAIAWHPYAGDPKDLRAVRAAYPDLPMYVTEMGPHIDRRQRDMLWWADLVLGTINSGCGAFVRWCFLLDEEGQPNTSQGFPCAGLLEIDSRTGELYESGQFRLFRHVGPFVKRGARVLEAPLVKGPAGNGGVDGIVSAAFRNPDGSQVVVLAFRGAPFARKQVQVKAGGLYYPLQVLSNSVTTLVLK